jgi:DNA-binding CsgD family transcriptional regulator
MAIPIPLNGSSVLTRISEIQNICNPLVDTLKVKYFRYMRLFNDSSRFILCNMPEVMQFFYEEGHYPLTWLDNAKPEPYWKNGYLTWAVSKLFNSNAHHKLEQDIKKYFRICQGVVLTHKGKDFIEIFDFASDNSEIYNIQIKTLRHFNFYFKQRASKLIQASHSEKLIVPTLLNSKIEYPLSLHENVFIKQTEIKKYFLTGQWEGIYLTQRELDCLNWCIAGKSADEAAILLNINKRTYEHHLERIKIKLGCYKQTQLVDIAIQQRLFLDKFNEN